MASEVISHAIFASSHPTPPPPRTASSSTPPPTPRFAPPPTPRFAPHLAPRFTPHPSLHSHPASRPALHPAQHSASHSALHPPRTASCPSPCAPTPFHTAHFHRTSLLPRIPLAKSLPPSHSIFLPSTHFPSASLHPPCPSAKPRLRIFSCVKRPSSLTT